MVSSRKGQTGTSSQTRNTSNNVSGSVSRGSLGFASGAEIIVLPNGSQANARYYTGGSGGGRTKRSKKSKSKKTRKH